MEKMVAVSLTDCDDVHIAMIDMIACPGSVAIESTNSTNVYVGEIVADLSRSDAAHRAISAIGLSQPGPRNTTVPPDLPEPADSAVTVEVFPSGVIRINGMKACPCGSHQQFRNCHGWSK